MRVIDDTDNDLRALIVADFGPSRVRDLHKTFIDWLHYKARRIPALPRAVTTSAEVMALLPRYPAIRKIEHVLRTGSDVGQWLSERTNTRKLDHAADMMFNDWQIAHFHLGDFFQSPSMIRRTGPLLFAYIAAAEATLLDVQPHGVWTRTALLEILLRTSPRALEMHEMRNVTPERLTDDQYRNLRAKGVNTLIEVGGRAFMPGMGLMSSRHAMRLILYADWFRGTVKNLKEQLEADQVPVHLKAAIYARIGVPARLGAWYAGGALSIIDKNRSGLVLSQMKPLE